MVKSKNSVVKPKSRKETVNKYLSNKVRKIVKIEKIDIKKLNPSEYNPRKDLQPEDSEYQKIKRSIEEFGFVEPLIINKDMSVIGGHQRLKVLKELGYSEIDCVVVDLDKIKEKALNIALNKIEGKWDLLKLKDLLLELDTSEIDMDITGFEYTDLEELMTQFHLPEENELDDEVPEVPEEPVTKLGDLYQLGEHRLLCGDAKKIVDVERLMDGNKADMVFTDPPYGEGYIYRGSTYEDKSDEYWRWLPLAFDNLDQYLTNGASLYIKHSSRQIPIMLPFLLRRYDIRNVIIWISNSQAHPKDNYDSYYEPIYYCSRGQVSIFNKRAELRERPKDYWSGEGKEFIGLLVNVWYDIPKQQAGCLNPEGGKIRNKKLHSCSMPVRLAERGLKISSNELDKIVDLFGGSGSTLIACEKLNRKCYMMEIDPYYCDVIVKRWENYTNKKAELVKAKEKVYK